MLPGTRPDPPERQPNKLDNDSSAPFGRSPAPPSLGPWDFAGGNATTVTASAIDLLTVETSSSIELVAGTLAGMDPSVPAVTILGLPVARLTHDAAINEIERLYDSGAHAHVAYANAHSLNVAVGDPDHMEVLRRCALVLNDGSGVALAAMMSGRPFPENLNGSDFNPRIIDLAARRGWSVFFLGGKPGVAAEAARRLGWRYPQLKVAGTLNGYTSNDEAVRTVKAAQPDVLMVAMGNPIQERFIDEYLTSTGARIGVGVGAYFDFTAKRIRRAPTWTNRAGVEWVFRLALEPRRMWRRYVLGNPLFILRAIKERVFSLKDVSSRWV